MRSVKVNVPELQKTVQDNKAKHVTEFEESWAEYVKACTSALDKVAETIKAGNPDFSELYKLPKPKSFAKHYDDFLELLGWEEQEEITLAGSEFQNYILDEWQWKEEFSISKSSLEAYNGPH